MLREEKDLTIGDVLWAIFISELLGLITSCAFRWLSGGSFERSPALVSHVIVPGMVCGIVFLILFVLIASLVSEV